MKKTFSIILINGFLFLVCKGEKVDTMIYTHPEVVPTFSYDTCNNFKNSLKLYFEDNYVMPELLLDNCYMGRIYIEFIVEKDGDISNIKLIKGIDAPLDKTVIETIENMPKWIPGSNNEKAVRTKFTIPISIRWLYGKIEN